MTLYMEKLVCLDIYSIQMNWSWKVDMREEIWEE